MNAGDFALGSTFDVKFTTIASTGAPITLAGTPAVAAYPDNSTTEVTAGITLSVDFDSRTGLHNINVVATSGNGYAAGKSYALVLTAGTVDSVSVVGYVVAHFTIERGAAFGRLGAPAGASTAADIAAIKTQTAAIEADTQDIQTQVGTAGAGLTNINLPDQTMNITGNITGNLSGSVGSVTGAVGSVTGNVGGNVAGSVGSVTGAVGSVTGNVGGNVAGSVGSVTAAVTVDDTTPVEVNVKKINDVTITGDGIGTPFNVA